MTTPDEAFEEYLRRLSPGATVDLEKRAAFISGWEAAMSALNAEEDKHIVEITDTGWTMMHPTVERFNGDLFDCAFNTLVATGVDNDDLGPGKFRVYLDETGVLLWDEVS